MAKAGFWLKGARGKLAGSVLQKSAVAGTVIRENVTPKNPRSQAQAVRRSTFAPAAKFYSPLSVVLEQSWEGKSKAESYQAFLSQAIKDCGENGWFVPKGTGFFPMPFQVSKGSIQSIDYGFSMGNYLLVNGTDDASLDNLNPSTIGGISQIFMGAGVQEGQQVTVIIVKGTRQQDEEGEPIGLWEASPYYMRFIVDPESNVATPFNGFTMEHEQGDGWYFTHLQGDGMSVIAGAIIISEFSNGKWRRSTQKVVVDDVVLDAITDTDAYDNSTASYRDSSDRLVESEIYLNDGVANVSAANANSSAKLVAHGAYVNGTWDDSVQQYFWPKTLEKWKNPIIENPQECLSAKGKLGSSLARENTGLFIKIGDQWLLSKTTKGPRPTGVSEHVITINGDDAATKTWLLSKGVDASVF